MGTIMKKNTVFQLSQYDVTQQIIETLTNVYSRAVLFSITIKAKDAQKIADEQKMSISTVYKILSNLEVLTLVYVDKFEISNAGKKIKYYKSRIKKAEIIVGGTTPTLNLQSN
ncbi:MAG: transcriptional regulator [Candidatus Nitrosotenuis sp.]|nr:transcriptional regulator [Candidatus Nitrosotenuis sp.]